MSLVSAPEDVATAFDKKPRKKFSPPPNGPYCWEVTGMERKKSQAGNDMVVLSLCIASGPYAEDKVEERDYFVFTDKAEWKLHQLAAVLQHKGVIPEGKKVDWQKPASWGPIIGQELWYESEWTPREYTVKEGKYAGEVRTGYRCNLRLLKEEPVPMEEIVTDDETGEDAW